MLTKVFKVINIAGRFRIVLTIIVSSKTLLAITKFASNSDSEVIFVLYSLSIK